MSSAPSKRSERKNKSRDALLRAGLSEFAEKGMGGASIRGICARAGYTPGAFYVHFNSLDEFRTAAMERVVPEGVLDFIRAGATAIDPLTALDFLASWLNRRLKEVEAGREGSAKKRAIEFHHLLTAAALSPQLRDRGLEIIDAGIESLTQIMRSAQERDEVRDDLPPEDMALHLVVYVLGLGVAIQIGVPLDTDSMRKLLETLAGPQSPTEPEDAAGG